MFGNRTKKLEKEIQDIKAEDKSKELEKEIQNIKNLLGIYTDTLSNINEALVSLHNRLNIQNEMIMSLEKQIRLISGLSTVNSLIKQKLDKIESKPTLTKNDDIRTD